MKSYRDMAMLCPISYFQGYKRGPYHINGIFDGTFSLHHNKKSSWFIQRTFNTTKSKIKEKKIDLMPNVEMNFSQFTTS